MAVTDLTGTKWVFNDSYPYGSIQSIARSVNFNSNNNSFVELGVEKNNADEATYIQYYTDNDVILVYDSTGYAISNHWLDQAYRTIEITGGTDATNADLIAWLEANATQIIEPTGNEYTLTQNLTNLTSGNITLTITADEGYSLPAQADIVVTGGTIVSYDDTTGELVVTAGTTAVEVTCESAVSTISFSIDGTTYQADDGMTWAQWVASAYNTDEYYINNGKVYDMRGQEFVGYGATTVVLSTDIIEANHSYRLLGGR